MRLPLPLPISLARLLGPSATVVGILAVGYLLATGRLDLQKLAGRIGAGMPTINAGSEASGTTRTDNLVTIASFNIQTFGKSKVAKDDVMEQLANICSYFDVVAVQEVRSPDAEPVQNLVQRMNAKGLKYDALISPPIGRMASHMEQYAFIYNTERVRPTDASRAYVINDPGDRMHREPYVANFTCIPYRTPDVADRAPFTFTLINVHTDPDEVRGEVAGSNELDVLADVFVNVRNWEYENFGEDDFVLLGDLNAQRFELRKLTEIPGMTSLCDGTPTNTSGTKEWDHIMVDVRVTSEFANVARVVDYQKNLGLSDEMAKAVSDHRPIWAQFSAFEIPFYPSGVATANSGTGTTQR